MKMCEACGQAPATRVDERGRWICSKADHRLVSRKNRRNLLKLQSASRSEELPEETKKTLLGKIKEMLT